LSDRQHLALNALNECVAARGKPPPGALGLPAGIKAVALTDWREQLLHTRVIDPESKNPRVDFKRLHQQLQARAMIGLAEGLVWPA
jgi:hypothetical protein